MQASVRVIERLFNVYLMFYLIASLSGGDRRRRECLPLGSTNICLVSLTLDLMSLFLLPTFLSFGGSDDSCVYSGSTVVTR